MQVYSSQFIRTSVDSRYEIDLNSFAGRSIDVQLRRSSPVKRTGCCLDSFGRGKALPPKV